MDDIENPEELIPKQLILRVELRLVTVADIT